VEWENIWQKPEDENRFGGQTPNTVDDTIQIDFWRRKNFFPDITQKSI
jgi:hypothetical protein